MGTGLWAKGPEDVGCGMVLKIAYPSDVKTDEERAAYRREFFAAGRKRFITYKSQYMKTAEGRAEWKRMEAEARAAEEELERYGL